MTDNKLALTNNPTISVLPTQGEWAIMRDMAAQLIPTGFLPKHIARPEQAVAIMLKGRELNIPPMYALNNIVVINGKPTANAELMLALVQRDHGINAMWVEESTNDHCTVRYRSGGGIKEYTFTIQDAEQAGLFGNQTWKKYPAAMLRARAISAVARMAFPGSIAGMYSPGELGEDVEVDEDGVVVTAPASAQNGAGRAEPQKMTPDTQARQTPPQRPAQAPTATVERMPDTAPDVLTTLPTDLLEAIATQMWKKDSWADMSASDRNKVRKFVEGKGPSDKQTAFDRFVADFMDEPEDDEDGVIEADVVEQGDLMPGEDTIPTPASFFTK